MSANNWLECPQCDANHASEEFNLTVELQQSYGKIPVEQYDDYIY